MLNWLKGLFGGKAPEVKAPVAPSVAPAAPVAPTPAATDLSGNKTEEVK